MNYVYTLRDRNHRALGTFTKAETAIDALHAKGEYVERKPDEIVHMNPVWEKEFRKHGDRIPSK